MGPVRQRKALGLRVFAHCWQGLFAVCCTDGVRMRRVCFPNVLLLAAIASAPAHLGRVPKRASIAASAMDLGSNLVTTAAKLLQLHTPAHVYHMDNPAARTALMDMLWTGEYASAAGRFSAENPELVSIFSQQRLDGADSAPDFRALQSAYPRFESVMRALFRARSQKYVPLETAALSVAFLHYTVPHVAWDAISYFTSSVMSRTWTDDFVDEAVVRDPGPSYPKASGITAAVFDNFMMKVGYKSFATDGQAGYQLTMTNWATAFLPALAVPAGFSIDAMMGEGGIFRTDLTLASFISLFSPYNSEILANKRSRWSKYLDAAITGTIWDKEPFQSPYPPTYFHYHPPIFDRLQSSYDDVLFELELIRRSGFHCFSDAIQIGGDGLSYMRLIHQLSLNPKLFLMTKPIIIPRLGEAPHGKFHVMHGDWRIWSPLIMRMAELLNNKQIKSDPTVANFNTHEHFLRILTRAFSEYVVEISRSGTDYHHSVQFLRAAELNISFAYICFFLYLFAFKYVQMRTAVRHNDSKTLDLIWRENLASARTKAANKTNYSQMTVSLIYWGYALVEPLQTVFHNTRTLRWLFSHVGWDMPIEIMNSWIKGSVVANITESQIVKFIRRLNFTHVVMRGVKAILHRFRKPDPESLKEIDADVEKIKKFLREKIGSDFNTATRPSSENLLGVDMSDWGGNQYPRQHTPWKQMERAMRKYRAYVSRNVTKLSPWHHWA